MTTAPHSYDHPIPATLDDAIREIEDIDHALTITGAPMGDSRSDRICESFHERKAENRFRHRIFALLLASQTCLVSLLSFAAGVAVARWVFP
jgi:hypothetical protein